MAQSMTSTCSQSRSRFRNPAAVSLAPEPCNGLVVWLPIQQLRRGSGRAIGIAIQSAWRSGAFGQLLL